MFKSIKPWMNLPAGIKPCIKTLGTGDKEFGSVVDTLCYSSAEVKIVRNTHGAEVTSNTQLYFDGNTQVSNQDIIVFEGAEHTIHAIATFYRNGVPDIKVVYV